MASRPHYLEALAESGVLPRLAAFDPHVAGTPPLRLDLPSSDIGILCYTPDPVRFAEAVWRSFSDCHGFAMWQWQGANRPVVARFHCAGWVFELFGQARPVVEQVGWRHFDIERRLLALGGSALFAAVKAQRRAGAKTEPAFAYALGLEGSLESLDDAALEAWLRRASHAVAGSAIC